MIAILDYGAGNLRSVENTLSEIGAEYTLVRDAAGLRKATRIILPGVGHFGQMMRALDEMSFGGAASLECGIPGDPDILLPRCVEFLRNAIGS